MRCLNAPRSCSRLLSLSARCRQASTATWLESALGALPAMLCISSSTLWASRSTSTGSPLALSVYAWPRIVTRTVFLPGGDIGLGPAELIDLPQELLDPAAHLLALGAQRVVFRRELSGLLHSGVLLLTQPVHKLHRLMNSLFKTAQGVGFLFEGFHGRLMLRRAPP